jgi:hypothetical protein
MKKTESTEKVKDGIKMVLSETISEVLPIVFFSKYLKPLKARKSHKPTLLAWQFSHQKTEKRFSPRTHKSVHACVSAIDCLV